MQGIQIVGNVGPVTGASGATLAFRQGNTGEQVVVDLHGRYYEQSWRKQLYTASNQAAQAVSVALTATYTGLCLSNPNQSGYNLVLLACNYALTVAPAAIASLHLIAGYSTTDIVHGTPLVSPGIRSTVIGGTVASVAKADSAATLQGTLLGAPSYLIPLVSGFTAAALPSMSTGWIDLGGAFIIPPGGWVAFGALTAVTGFGAFLWEEVVTYAP